MWPEERIIVFSQIETVLISLTDIQEFLTLIHYVVFGRHALSFFFSKIFLSVAYSGIPFLYTG